MIEFHKVAELDDLEDGRVRTVVVGTRTFALTRVGDRYGVLSNHGAIAAAVAHDGPALVEVITDLESVQDRSNFQKAGCNVPTPPETNRLGGFDGARRPDMHCNQFVEIVTDYLDGALAPVEMAGIDAHVGACTGCVRVLDQFRETIRQSGRIRERDVERMDPAVRDALTDAFTHHLGPGA